MYRQVMTDLERAKMTRLRDEKQELLNKITNFAELAENDTRLALSALDRASPKIEVAKHRLELLLDLIVSL